MKQTIKKLAALVMALCFAMSAGGCMGKVIAEDDDKMNLPSIDPEDGASRELPVTLYYRLANEELLVGVESKVSVRAGERTEAAVIRALKEGSAVSSGVTVLIPSAASLRELSYEDGVLYVTLSEEFLNEDMVSFAEPLRRLEVNHPADDKASLNKFNGRYYLTYGGYYAIADNVYGPYEFKGHTGASMDHTSYFEWNGQIFNAITVVDHFGLYRSSGMCYVHIRENGDLVTDPLIVEYGVGQYDSEWNRIEAEWFMRGTNVKKAENKDSYGFSVACTKQAVLAYPKVRNLADKKGLFLHVGCVGGGGEIELREGTETGRLIGSVRFKDTGPRFQWQFTSSPVIPLSEPLSDVTDICLVLKPDPGAELRLDHFHFYKEAIHNP